MNLHAHVHTYTLIHTHTHSHTYWHIPLHTNINTKRQCVCFTSGSILNIDNCERDILYYIAISTTVSVIYYTILCVKVYYKEQTPLQPSPGAKEWRNGKEVPRLFSPSVSESKKTWRAVIDKWKFDSYMISDRQYVRAVEW